MDRTDGSAMEEEETVSDLEGAVLDLQDVETRLEAVNSLMNGDTNGNAGILSQHETLQELLASARDSSHYNNANDSMAAAKMNVAFAFGLASMYFSLHNIQGKQEQQTQRGNAQQHPILGEIGRIKSYVQRVAQIEKNIQRRQDGDGVEQAEVEAPALKLDKDAAARIIKHNLDSLDDESKGTVEKVENNKGVSSNTAKQGSKNSNNSKHNEGDKSNDKVAGNQKKKQKK
jgi:hypothetical protein